MLCEHSSATVKTLVCYQHYFQYKSKALHHTGCYWENELHPSQTQYKEMEMKIKPGISIPQAELRGHIVGADALAPRKCEEPDDYYY